MVIAPLALIVLALGLITYLAASGKASELGRLMFFAGLLAFLLAQGAHPIHLN